MKGEVGTRGHGFGTWPVFLASLSTILGAILFLRMGYSVAHAGLTGTLLIIFIGHLITIPTGLAMAEIATNLKVEGGGAYFIISRSFGPTIGAAIGISLYLSQAVSIAFYLIAFSAAFQPLLPIIQESLGFQLDLRMISVPAAGILALMVISSGARLGVNALWLVFFILLASLGMFLFGSPIHGVMDPQANFLTATVDNPASFITVFAICFPAFTGMTAGVGLSGDLKNPGRSIPMGTLTAILAGMAIYILVAYKLAVSATPEQLDSDPLIMGKIALWDPIIPIGLGAATLSSAIGSFLVAPRTLQALGADRVFPVERMNYFFSRGRGKVNEPTNATLFTTLVVLAFLFLGEFDFVAQLISMFFMVTYGAICTVSFLEHFAGNPSYRPSFRSKWYVSLLGAVMCFMMMFQMQPVYALLALIIMLFIYLVVRTSNQDARGLATIFQGVMFQLTRRIQIFLQKNKATFQARDWRPSFIAISRHTLSRTAPLELLKWICHRYGFGTIIHYMEGYLSSDQSAKAHKVLDKLIEQTEASGAEIFVDTMVSPSFKTTVAQAVQFPGISGLENNSVLFEFSDQHPEELDEIVEGVHHVDAVGFNTCVLRSSQHHFGYRRTLHVWLTRFDGSNTNLLVLLAYIILGHPEWKRATLTIFATFPAAELEKELLKLNDLIATGRLPISTRSVRALPADDDASFRALVEEHSREADLVIVGFPKDLFKRVGKDVFLRHKAIHDLLFVNANQDVLIS